MPTFEWKTWGGDRRTLEADRVEFAPAHVVFWRREPFEDMERLVLAETNTDVHHLRPVDEDA